MSKGKFYKGVHTLWLPSWSSKVSQTLVFVCGDRGQPWGHFSGSSACCIWRQRFSVGLGSLWEAACLLVPSTGSKVQSTVCICLHECWGPNSVLPLSTLTPEPLPQALEGPSFFLEGFLCLSSPWEPKRAHGINHLAQAAWPAIPTPRSLRQEDLEIGQAWTTSET